MSHLATQDIGAIVSHIANVIEGDDTFGGIPGRNSINNLMDSDGMIEFTADSVDDYEFVQYSAGAWPDDTFVTDETPPFFLVNDTAGRARKIIDWTLSSTKFETKYWTDGSVTLENLVDGDLDFVLMQGFKRIQGDVDFLGGQGGFDRNFRLSSDGPGERLPISGAGTSTYRATIDLDLRLLRPKGIRDTIEESMTANLAILTDAIMDKDQRCGLVRLMRQSGGQTEILKDEYKFIARQSFDITYRIINTFK